MLVHCVLTEMIVMLSPGNPFEYMPLMFWDRVTDNLVIGTIRCW